MTMNDSDDIVFKFNDKIDFWLIRADGGKYYDDFVNNDYIGIRYNRITVDELNKLANENIISVDAIKDLMFDQYAKENQISIDNLPVNSRRQLTVHAKQTYLFAFGMKIGDLVLTPAKKSYKFALGVIVGKPYDENADVVQKRIKQMQNEDIVYPCSDYRKRRKIHWISVISRQDLPKELAWIMNAHQATAKLSIQDKSKLFNLVSPIYNYNHKYYLRVYTSHGGNLSMYDWYRLVSVLPEEKQKNIDLKADVNSHGYLTFLTSNFSDLISITKVIIGPTAVSGGAVAIIKMLLNAIVGKDNLKKEGLVEWAQDVARRHSDNKLHNLKNKQECEKIKRGKLANEFDLEIKRQGKPIEKNKDTVVPFHLDDEDDDSKFSNKKKES